MSSYPQTCSICLDDISLNRAKKDDKVTMLECNHPFHTKCISQLRSNKCPSCRRRFTNISSEILSQILQRENADILSRNTENLNFVLLELGNAIFDPPEVRHQFLILDDIVASLIGSLPPSMSPIISALLNTPVQGITFNSMVEDYIERHTAY